MEGFLGRDETAFANAHLPYPSHAADLHRTRRFRLVRRQIWPDLTQIGSFPCVPCPTFAMENSCISVTGRARSVGQLKIEGFSATGSMGNNEYFPTRWSVGGYDWEVRIFPRSFDRVQVGLFSLSGSCTSGSKVSICCQLIDPTGKVEPPSEENIASGKFYHDDECAPMVYLMSRPDLLKSGYLRDDTLTMQCTVTVLNELPEQFIPADEVVAASPSTNLHQNLGELLERDMGADITFIVGDESFAAHKIILAARSPVFKAQFFGDMKEKCSTRQVEIKDMEVEVFRALLRFIYTDTVPELDDQSLEAVATMALHLLEAADRYGLDRLRLICELKLIEGNGLTVDTAAATLALAEQHNFSRLKARCLEFIVSTPAVLEAVLATEGYKHLAASCPSLLAYVLNFAYGGKN